MRLPVPLQHLACSLEGRRIQRSRYGGGFPRLLGEAREREGWTSERIHAFRDERLRAFVEHCAGTVPFYRRRFRELGIDPQQIRSLEDLKHLPVLSKEEVQQNLGSLISESVPAHQRVIVHTSGTTGRGLRFPTTHSALQEQWATWWRYRRWHGILPENWCAVFGGRSVVPLSQNDSPFWRINLPGRQILFSAYHLNRENATAYLAELRSRRPPWLHGYPSLLALLAGHLLELGADLGYDVRWVTTSSENLHPRQAELLEQAFGVRPLQHYGMAEAIGNMSECEAGRLHIDEDFGALELVSNEDGSDRRILGTNFTNPALPLLRYEVGDLATICHEPCPCGRWGRIVGSIDGRLEDYIILANGVRIGRMDHVFKDMVNIREAQLRQARPGEVLVRVVRGAQYTGADEAALLYEMRKRVGETARIEVEYLPRIERSQSGKLRFVVSELREGRIDGVHSGPH
jgi:phenylacetate-CoA ligase